MTTTHDPPIQFDIESAGRPILPDNPFVALHYHFGMLLGVDDLETEQGFHHGKMRLHNAWLHRSGVVWGLGVEADLESSEIKVEPGLALDAGGHELYLDRLMCVDIGAWYNKNAKAVTVRKAGNSISFDARVEISYRPCLTRPVPALAEPCAEADDCGANGTAYSRVLETVEICLVPAPAEEVIAPYHRLRLLFGLDEPRTGSDGKIIAADKYVLDEREKLASLADDARPAACLQAFRALAALDVTEMSPGVDAKENPLVLFPAAEFTPIVLANVSVTLVGSARHWALKKADVDIGVRPSHVATSTIQELLCRACIDETTLAKEGPQVVGVEHSGEKTIVLTTDTRLAKASVAKDAFSVSVFTEQRGWSDRKVTKAQLDAAGKKVTLTLDAAPTGAVVRVVASGSGPRPLLSTDHKPLAGSRGDPPGQVGARDSVHHLEGSP